ncbi:Phospholipase C [Xylographa soralifera]|nr:Phospholipase C [Xylographa soralifera]
MTSSVTTSPRLRSNSGLSSSSSRPRSPFARKPSKQHIVTTIPLGFASVSSASPGAPSLTTSSTNTSIQSSPEGPRGRNHPLLYSPTPLQLPESTLGSAYSPVFSPSHNAMSEALHQSKVPSLMRRISRGASNTTSRLIRRRQSSNSVTNRDQSSGPVTMRRRSGAEVGVDPGSEGDDEDVLQDPLSLCGLESANDSGVSSSASTLKKPARTEGGIAPIVPSLLRNGTSLMKITKKKRKTLTFVLDVESAKVSWDPGNTSKRFYVDDIQQIRLRAEARNYREEFQISEEFESRWFTIVYADQDRAKGRPIKTMHLIAPSQHFFELWTSTLDDLSRYRHNLMKGLAGPGQDEKTLQGHWKCEMAKRFGESPMMGSMKSLDLAGVEALCRNLHINCSSNLIRAQFDKADSKNTGYLNFEEFKDFVRRLKERDDLKRIYKTLVTADHEGLNLDSFLEFLQFTQGIDVDTNRTHWQKVFGKFVRKALLKSPTVSQASSDESPSYMGFEAFCSFLFSTHNSIVPTKPSEIKLNQPINEYFISSSHNTYLLGRQLAGNSSTEPYIRALQRACRCVEIDCWDGPDGRPIVSHGRTLTTSVLFSDCISAISKYAFVESPYPLTLSLEVHCNPVQQQAMVDIMERDLGEWLVRDPYTNSTSVLPSPEDLRNKILIKVKTGEDPMDKGLGVDIPNGRRQRSASSPWARPQNFDNTHMLNIPLLSSPPSMSPPDFPSPKWGTARGAATAMSLSSATDDSDNAQNGTLRPRRRKTKKSKIINSLGNLAVYTRGLKYAGFNDQSQNYNHIYSLAEPQFVGICADPDAEALLEKHNMRYLMRVYPNKYRFRSSNPDPLAFWRRGVQMVALNWQTNDCGMQINEAMFAGGIDRTGFVLKPDELRERQDTVEPMSATVSVGATGVHKQLVRFSVDMISAQQLPLPRGSSFEDSLDPYIEIEIFSAEEKGKGAASGEGGQDAPARTGMAVIGAALRKRSRVAHSNGYNPIFNDKFKFSLETKYPSLVFVRWTVWDSPDGVEYDKNKNALPLATFTAKLNSLQQGYRHLPLYDHNGDQFLFSTLFCRIAKEEPVVIEGDYTTAEKLGRFKQLSKAVLKRTMSIDRKRPKERIQRQLPSKSNS